MDGTDLSPRVRALCDLDVAGSREQSGRHEYDGLVQDLSPAGVRAGLETLRAASQNRGARTKVAAARSQRSQNAAAA